MLQQLCEKVKGWDDAIPSDILRRWRKWLRGLPCLAKLEIPRCFRRSEVDIYELHTFCDSYETGLGCVSYLRMITQAEIEVAFAMGKSKVVPKAATFEYSLARTAGRLNCCSCASSNQVLFTTSTDSLSFIYRFNHWFKPATQR